MKILVSDYIAALLPAGAELRHSVREEDGETVVRIYAELYGDSPDRCQPLEIGQRCQNCG